MEKLGAKNNGAVTGNKVVRRKEGFQDISKE